MCLFLDLLFFFFFFSYFFRLVSPKKTVCLFLDLLFFFGRVPRKKKKVCLDWGGGVILDLSFFVRFPEKRGRCLDLPFLSGFPKKTVGLAFGRFLDLSFFGQVSRKNGGLDWGAGFESLVVKRKPGHNLQTTNPNHQIEEGPANEQGMSIYPPTNEQLSKNVGFQSQARVSSIPGSKRIASTSSS